MSANKSRNASNAANDSADYRLDRYGFFADGTNDTEENLDIEKLQSREKKWLEMLKNWDYWMSEKFQKVRDRCRKGIPPSVRARAWLKLSGAEKKIQESQGTFKRYVESEADPKCIADIARDVGRQFPEHVMFHTSNPEETHLKFSQLENSPNKRAAANVLSPLSGDGGGSKGHIGQNELYRVLKAYCVHNRRDGYCQAQAPIAAALIMQMPDEEQAFWVMERIFDVYLTGYYKDGLEQMQIDGEILMELLKAEHPKIFKLFNVQKIEPPLFMTDWFMCCFIRSLPWPSVLRVLDMFLCEGVKVLFRVALAIISNTLNPKAMKTCSSQFETLPLIKRPPKEVLAADFLVKESLKTHITERDIAAAHVKVLRRWKENNRFRDQQRHQMQSQQQNRQPIPQSQQNGSPFRMFQQHATSSNPRSSAAYSRLELADVMHSQQFEDLRRQARHLENELEMKLISYNKLCSAFTTSQFSDNSPLLGKSGSDPTADTMTIEIEQLINKLTSLNDRMADFSQQMSSTPSNSSASSQSSLFHVVQRHRDIMQDYSREFAKTRSNLQSAKDRADLLGSSRASGPGNTSLSNRRAEMYNKELGHILNTDRMVDEQIELVMSTKDHLIGQRSRIQTFSQRLNMITNKYPMLNSLMNRINFRKRRDAIIIAVVVSFCVLLLLIYAVR